MKTYEEMLFDIEDDIELMGESHIVYIMEENGTIAEYDYLPSDTCTISITLKDLQETLHQKILYEKASGRAVNPDKTLPKLAVIFPGIGYTADKPLLYYTGRLARQHGYQIRTVSYGSLPDNIKGNAQKMHVAFEQALEQTECSLQDIDWDSYGEILFISKSIGTVVSAAYANRHSLSAKSILFTPLAETFSFPLSGCIAFHGTADPWAETSSIRTLAEQKEVPLFLTENANHSLETDDVLTNISILQDTLKRAENFVVCITER